MESRFSIEDRCSFVVHLLVYKEKSRRDWSIVIARQTLSDRFGFVFDVQRSTTLSSILREYRFCVHNWTRVAVCKALAFVVIVDPYNLVFVFDNG